MIKIPHAKGIMYVKPEDIIRIEASSNYCRVYFTNAYPLMVAKLLQWFQVRLPVSMFTRVHRSHLINNFFVTGTIPGRQSILKLSSGENIKVSRRRKMYLCQFATHKKFAA